MQSSPYDGLYWENSVPLGLHYLLQDLTKQSAKDPNTPDIWTPSSEREWLSLPRGAKSYTVKHNIFTFPDTGNFFSQEGERTTTGNNNLTPDYGDDLDYGQSGYGSQIARSLNPDYFNWVPIAYNSYAFPLNVSVNAAVERAVTMISGTPGKIFLIGHGQGAMVTSKLYDEFRSGRLASRKKDLLGVYHFGNPLRQSGRGVPGGPASGHGMAPFAQRLAATEDLVWEFASPDDPIATQQDNEKGEWATSIYNALNQQITGPDSLLEEIIELVFNPFGEIPALLSLFNDIKKQLLSSGGAHNNYQNFYPIPGVSLNAIDTAIKNIVDLSVKYPPETINKPLTEVLTINYRQPVSVSEISFEALRNSVQFEIWYQDRLNKWRQMTTEDSVPITLTLGATDAVSWYKFHTMTYPIVAKAIQFRATRSYDPLVGETPYCVGLKNILVRRNVYDRASGLQSIDDEQDALGNVITKTIKDWDASKAIDDSANTFWRSAPQPDPNAVVSLYLDLRDVNGNPQLVDKIYIDPVYTGQSLNLYYSNDETAISRKLNPTSLQPDETQQNYEWVAGSGLKDATIDDSQTSQYQVPFSVGPMVSQDCWIGIQWTPSFKPYDQKVTEYSFSVTNRTVTLTGVTSPTLANIQSIYDTTTNTLLYSKSRDMASSSFNTSTKVLTLPVGNITANCANTDVLEIYYGINPQGPAPTQLVLFETVADNTSGSQYWPKVYFDVGSATIKLQFLNLTNGTPILYTAPLAPLFEANTPLHIVVGWTYSTTNPTIRISVRNNRNVQLCSYEVTDSNFPQKITFDGKIKLKNWRGILGAHIVKQESYSISANSFLDNPNTYTNPEPILVSKNGTVPASSLDEAIMASDWTVQQFAAGGAHTTSYSDKEWTPIWSNYFTEKGFLYLPRATRMKYLKMEFTQLTPEPYPVYDQGIRVSYQIYPVSVTQTQMKRPTGLLGVLSNIANAIGSINWLNPSTVSKAVNSIFGRTVQPVQTTLQIGPGYTANALPNTTQSAIADSTRTEANSPWVYRRTPMSPFSLVQNFLGTLFGQNTSQTKPSIPSLQQSMITNQTKIVPPAPATPATLPIQGQDWYVFPGQTLRMPASVIEGITKSQVVTRRDTDKSIRTRFDFTAVHKYETKTVTLDAAIAYFAGIREVQPYIATYIDEEDPAEFKFDQYDEKFGWTHVNVNQLDTGPITANSNPYVVNNGSFDLNISEWSASGNWAWDNSEGHTVKDTWQPGIPLIYGSARVTANGTNQSLTSSPITVNPSDEINFSAWVVYKDANSTANGKISVDAIGLNGTTVITQSIDLGTNMKIMNPQGFSVATYGVKAIHLYGTATVPVNVNNLKLRLNVNNLISAGQIYFDDIEMTPSSGVVGSVNTVINTKSRFSRLHCEFTNSGLRRSDSMWALATGNYLATLPATVYNTVAASGNGSRATLTLDGPPDFVAGSQITVSGMTPEEYNGVWTVFAVSTTSPYTVSFNCTATGNQTVAGTVEENRSESPNVVLANTNASRTALAYYTETIPSNVPDGMWGDTFGSWGYSTPALYQASQNTTPASTAPGNEVKWGTPFSTVSIQIDPNMIYDKKRVIHFYRAAKKTSGPATGEAGIVVRQETNFVSDGLFRICARWYKAKKTNNTVKLRLRRVSGDTSNGLYPYGYVYQETVGGADTPVPTGYWYTHQTKWARIPNSQDQTYALEFVLDGDQEDDIYLNDLWVEISQVRYHVRLGGGVDHDVTALAYTDNCTVGTTVPVSQMELSTTIYGDRSFAYTSKFTPLYLK